MQPKIPDISVGTSNGQLNGTDLFDLVRSECSGPASNVVHFDRSGCLGRWGTEMSLSILFDKIVVPSTALLYPAWVGAVQPECNAPLGTWNFRNFKPEFLLNGIMESAPSLHLRVAQPRRGRSVCHNQSINRSFNVNTWDGVAPIIRARSSCIKRMTIKILSQ